MAHNEASTSANNATGGVINAIEHRVKLPDFVEEHTDLWFWQVESAFEASGILSDKKKYNTIIGHLPTRVMYKLADLRNNPPEQGQMYTTLKDRITNEFADSKQTKITKLLGNLELGDRKPSQLLAEMRTKASNTPVTDDLLSQLWIRNLPEQIRMILSADDKMDLNTLAMMADRILEATRSNKSFVSATEQKSNTAIMVEPVTVNQSSQINQLEKQVTELTRIMKNFMNDRSRQRSKTPTNKHQSQQSYNDNDEQQRQFDYCWWHHKFGSQARKCKEPCKFNTGSNSNNTKSGN